MVWESISLFHDIFVIYYIFLYVSTNILFKKPQAIGLCDGFYLVQAMGCDTWMAIWRGIHDGFCSDSNGWYLQHPVARWFNDGKKCLLAFGKGMPSLLRSVKKSARGADVQRNLNNDATDKLTEWLLLLRPTAMLAWLPLPRWISRFACRVSSKDTSPRYSEVLIGMSMGYEWDDNGIFMV